MRLAVLLAAVAGASAILAQEPAAPAKPTRVALKAGAPPAVQTGTVAGRDEAAYVVAGRKGQTLAAALKSANTSLYFNVYPPGGGPEALYASDREATGNSAAVVLPSDGDYRIQVYLYRNAARRGAKAAYTLELSLK